MKTTIDKIDKINPEKITKSRSLWLQRGIHILLRLNAKNKFLLPSILAVMLVMLIVILTLIHHQSDAVSNFTVSENEENVALNNRLNDMRSELAELATNTKSSLSYQHALNNMSANLAAIQKNLNGVAQNSAVQHVSHQIVSMNQDVDSQFLDVKREIANSQNKDYLDPNVLPFRVISIDVISNQPFVSIDYAHHVTPFQVGDTLAGWQVVAADYDAAEVEFKNDKDQYVKVIAQG